MTTEDEKIELPEEYDDTRLVLMVRDPEWIFCYWEISKLDREKFGLIKGEHEKKMVIRVYDITGLKKNWSNARSFFDIEVNDYTNSWYMKIPKSGKTYVADLGYIERHVNFTQVVRSNSARVPKKTLSPPKQKEVWGNLTWDSAKGADRLKSYIRNQDEKRTEEILKMVNKGALEYDFWGSS